MVGPQRKTLEREVKFGAPMSTSLPDLRDLVGRTERLPQQRLETAYFDTADGRLWQQGLTFRFRATDGAEPGTWTLKLPRGAYRTALERTEMSWSGWQSEVPQEGVDIVRGLIRREPLQHLVALETLRQRLALHDEDDTVVAELDDDAVTVVGGPRDGLRFRQVELELHGATKSIARAVTARLEETGLVREAAQKLATAMGLKSAAASPRLGRRSLISDVVRTAVSQSLDRLLEHDWRLRLALPDPAPEDVHHARVATRRLRSDLKTFQVLLDPIWVSHVRSDLKWLGSALGEVRDIDVLAKLDDLPDELRRELARQRAAAGRQLRTTLDSERCLRLLDHLHAATHTPPFVVADNAVHANHHATDVLPVLVGARWRKLHRQVRKAGTRPSNRQLHRIRIKAKQVRYAAEAAAPVVGGPARHTASAAEKVQTVLGQHHDAVAAEAWLREQSSRIPSSASFEAGRLSAEQDRIQRKLRRHWRRSWKELARSKGLAWLS